MSSTYSYRNLIVWERAQKLALAIIQLVERYSGSSTGATIARQIIRAATSIGANIAEGHARYTPGAHRNHLSIAKGSAAETDSWLDLLRRLGWLTVEDETLLHAECVEIMAILTHKILELERLTKGASSELREQVELYIISADTAPVFPFIPEDYHLEH